LIESSKDLKAWRDQVRFIAQQAFIGAEPFNGAVEVLLNFRLPRPKSHYRTGRFAHVLRDDAPIWVTTRPDVDKLARAILDALTGVGYCDDSQVASLAPTKRYVDPYAQRGFEQVPGVMIYVAPLPCCIPIRM